MSESPTLTGTRCASINGFFLHANTHVLAHRRDQLERLLNYTTRGAVSLERLEEGADGDLLYTFTRPWSPSVCKPLSIRSRRSRCAAAGYIRVALVPLRAVLKDQSIEINLLT